MDISHGAPTIHVHPVHLSGEQTLDTVRALHQTVVSLRAALEQSRNELLQLRIKVSSSTDTRAYKDTIEKLSLENHILRQRVIESGQLPQALKEDQLIGVQSSMDDTSKKDKEQETHVAAQREQVIEATSLDKQDLISESCVKKEHVSKATIITETKEYHSSTEKISESKKQTITMSSHSNPEAEESADAKVETSVDNQTEYNEEEGENVDDSTEKRVVDGEEAPSRSKGAQLSQKSSQESDNDSEEVDDIELIFTTDETKELEELQEDLVSITDVDQWNASACPTAVSAASGNAFKSSSEFSQVEKGTQLDEQSSGIRFAGSTWAHSVLIETDISKCGVIDENEAAAAAAGAGPRRNTLPCPPPYRSLLVGAKSPVHGVKFSTRSPRSNGSDFKRSPMRPILVENNCSPKRESEAQTDITALPLHWKSESYLAHKVSHQFTTLPSKFALPSRESMYSRPSLKICERNQDARRVLLSDINFTSMVPELSRSADHLSSAAEAAEAAEAAGNGQSCGGNLSSALYRNYPRAFSYMKNPDLLGPVSPGLPSQRNCVRFLWSPCDCSSSSSHTKWDQSHCYQCLSSSHTQDQDSSDARRRHSLKPSTSYLDVCRHGQPVRRSLSIASASWQSEPASPTHCQLRSRTGHAASGPGSPASSGLLGAPALTAPRIRFSGLSSPGVRHSSGCSGLGRGRSRVTFQDSGIGRSARGGQSLPDLRAEYQDSGDSTDSLIDEAEEYLRRSIDSIVTGADWSRVARKRQGRRHSDPDPIREISAPKYARPFLPKSPSDLKPDYVVKVITAEGRVAVGRVRYVGAVVGFTDPYVGVELSQKSGDSDGTFRGRRYFDCDTGFACFMPFKKIVMAWCT